MTQSRLSAENNRAAKLFSCELLLRDFAERGCLNKLVPRNGASLVCRKVKIIESRREDEINILQIFVSRNNKY